MLTRETTARPSARQIFENHWLQTRGNNHVPDKILAKASVKNLSRFSAASKLQRAPMSFIVSQSTTVEEMTILRESFSSRDKTGEGLLNREEVIEAISRLNEDVRINVKIIEES